MYQLGRPKREEGQGLVEYALILVLVAIVVIVILSLLGNQVNLVFVRVNAALNGQPISGQGTEYVIGNFSVSATGGPLSCNVAVSNIQVTVLQDGQPAPAGVNVSVSVTASGGGSGTSTGQTNASGVANTSNVSFSSNCSGTVTVSGQGNSRSVSY